MTQGLLEAALAVRERAYVPYSRFKVGAALMTASGKVYVGCNVENAAYPEGTCAEAGAIAAMVAGGDLKVTGVTVVADSPLPCSPCGGCRQKLAEFGDADTPVTLATTSGKVLHTTIGALLPGVFTSAYMEDAPRE